MVPCGLVAGGVRGICASAAVVVVCSATCGCMGCHRVGLWGFVTVAGSFL